jgi:tRNA(Arg) A34 adenosine deaminase TadA
MWSEIDKPWQACLELAWEAYCDDCVPIGAVVTDAGGKIISRGRNRVYPRSRWIGHPLGAEIAHAEVEALTKLDFTAGDYHEYALYTTTEPCPMCMGTLYMSGVSRLYYAARDPFAGSTNLLERTWYLSRKPVRVFGPEKPAFENIIIAIFVEQDCGFHSGRLPDGDFYHRMGEVVAAGVELGQRLWEIGELPRLRKVHAPAEEMVDNLSMGLK